MKLKDEELIKVEGGAIKAVAGMLTLIGGLITLITGIIDGYLNPIKCR